MTFSFQPVIIIGATRSGTNMLRDLLTALPGFGTWPCDEINLIWRHGNIKHPTDELTAENARPDVRNYVCRTFDKLARRIPLTHVVEKTCANSLRVGFVHAIFPHAKFVYIVRDGRDVVLSARRRWTAPLDLPYVLAKARFVPWSDLPYHGVHFLRNRIHRAFVVNKQLKTWGPRFVGIDEAVKNRDLDEVCAMQWRACVDASDRDLAVMEQHRVHKLRYEDIAADPETEMARLAQFLEVEPNLSALKSALVRISLDSVGRWRTEFDWRALEVITPILAPVLARHGYPTDNISEPYEQAIRSSL